MVTTGAVMLVLGLLLFFGPIVFFLWQAKIAGSVLLFNESKTPTQKVDEESGKKGCKQLLLANTAAFVCTVVGALLGNVGLIVLVIGLIKM